MSPFCRFCGNYWYKVLCGILKFSIVLSSVKVYSDDSLLFVPGITNLCPLVLSSITNVSF